MIFDRYANLKYRYGNRHFWCKGYYVDTVGKNKKSNRRIHKKKTITRRYSDRLNKYKRIYGSV